MDLGLSGKTAVVTGASRGIGLATAEALSSEGAKVVAVARTLSPALKDLGVTVMHADLTTSSGANELVRTIGENYSKVDLLVNNVGGGQRLGLTPFAQLTDDEWDDAIATNLMSAVRVTRSVLPLMGQGSAVVNVSSIGAHRPDGPPLAYNVAKAALTALGTGMAKELAQRGMRVNTVSPGPTRTAMWESSAGLGGQLAAALDAPLEAIIAGAPDQVGMLTGRLSEPDEVAALICFLLSERAGNITGADYVIDGGAVRGY